jgi:hypothetical protein
MLYRVHLTWVGFELTTLVVICTDCIGSYKSNYHTITTTTVPQLVIICEQRVNIKCGYILISQKMVQTYSLVSKTCILSQWLKSMHLLFVEISHVTANWNRSVHIIIMVVVIVIFFSCKIVNTFTAVIYINIERFLIIEYVSSISSFKSLNFTPQDYICKMATIDIVEAERGRQNLIYQKYNYVKLKSSLRTFYGRHHDLVDRYGISVSQMTTDWFHLSWELPCPFPIHDLSPGL